MSAAPTGVVAFLFTDVVGSTRAWADHPDEMDRDLERHDELVRAATGPAGGYVFYAAGDSFGVAFSSVRSAVDAAVEIQRALRAVDWELPGGLGVRTGIHVGEAVERDGDYFGTPVNVTNRLMSVAHGGQILLSGHAAALVDGVRLVVLGHARLRDVEQPVEVFQVEADGRPEAFPPLRTEDAQLSTLPRYRSSFVGRQREIDHIRTLLARHQLVTVTGVGGAGKTRVAVEVAAAELPDLDGAFFVDLQRIDEVELVPSTFAAAAELNPGPGTDPIDDLARFLRDRAAIFVVDNCEHLLDEVAEIVDVLLQRAPSVRVLATSREALEIEGEETFRLPSLPAEETGLRLFVERARAIDDSFTLDADGRAAVVELCRRLDGMPLAIELAAGRARTSSPQELLAGLDDRFVLLRAGRRRGVMARQRTLEAAIEWSYDLLDDDEQRFFRRLGVFAGPFTFDLVPKVTGVDRGTALDLLDSMAAKSLVTTGSSPGGGTHVRLLETLRAFAVDRLIEAGEVADTRDRHVEALVEAFDVDGPGALWLGGLHDEYRLLALEVLAAAEHAMATGRPDLGVQLVMPGGYSLVGHGDFGALARVVDRLRADFFDDLTRTRQAQLLGVLAGTHMITGDVVGSFTTAMEGIAEYRDTDLDARYLLQNCALILTGASDPELAWEALGDVVDEYRAADPATANLSALTQGLSDHEVGILASERRYADALFSLGAREVRPGDDWRRPIGLSQEGWLRELVGQPFDAEAAGMELGDYGWWFAARIALQMCRPVDLETRAAAIADLAAQFWHERLAGEEAEYLAAFGRLAHLRGDDEHARTLLDLCVTRSPWIIWAMTETYAAIDGWTDDEWDDRRRDMIFSRLGRAWAADRRDRAADLLRAEVGRWGVGSRVAAD